MSVRRAAESRKIQENVQGQTEKVILLTITVRRQRAAQFELPFCFYRSTILRVRILLLLVEIGCGLELSYREFLHNNNRVHC